MKSRLINILKDLYYRFKTLPLMFLFWTMIIIWHRRVEKYKMRMIKNRLKLNQIWQVTEFLKGKKLISEQEKLKALERDFLKLEEYNHKDEEQYLLRQEQFDYYLKKILDPKIGK